MQFVVCFRKHAVVGIISFTTCMALLCFWWRPTQPSRSVRVDDADRVASADAVILNYSQLLNIEWDTREDPVRIVHQSWKTARLPPRFANWSLTWRACFPDWTHVLWSDEDNERFVREHYAWFLERYRTFKKHIYRVDAVRYLYLHHFGGIYTDLDNLCLRPFEHLLRGRGLVFGDMERDDMKPAEHWVYIQNSLLYSRRAHPFWLELVSRIAKIDAGADGLPESLTGPVAMMNALRDRWERYAAEVNVYPPETFNPFSYVTRKSPCRDLNQMDDQQLRTRVAHRSANPDSYVLQLHTQTWDRGKSIDVNL